MADDKNESFGPKSEKEEKALVLGKKESPVPKNRSKLKAKDQPVSADDDATRAIVRKSRRDPAGKKVEGNIGLKRYDRPGRRLGGRVGGHLAPLSSTPLVSGDDS